jgi:thiol-disulfide isomerase/thioredoxin
VPNADIRNMIMPGLFEAMLQQMPMQDNRPLLEKFKTCCTDQNAIRNLTQRVLMYEKLFPGNPSPYFACYDSSGKTYSLANFKGKVVYVDVWATWCGPCKREIPELMKLEKEMEHENIQFLSISTDRDVNAWKNFLRTQPMGGLQLHQSDNMDESVSKAFVVNSIPRFLLFDQEGRIVSSDAPRPSSGEEIRKLIQSVLQKEESHK